MARSVEVIKKSITTQFMSSETLAGFYGFTVGEDFDLRFSKVSFEGMLFYIVASAINIIEQMFDTHKADVETALSQRSAHNVDWWVNIAKTFQFGDYFNPVTRKYDVIDASKQVVAYASCDEDTTGALILKIARKGNNGLEPLSTEQKTAFDAYFRKAKDLGVKANVINSVGDGLKLTIDIFYDPMVLNGSGFTYNDLTEPARETVKEFIQNLPFNGEFIIASLVDALQKTRGVVIPTVTLAQSRYGTNDYTNIDALVNPRAGYLIFEDEETDLIFHYRPYDVN